MTLLINFSIEEMDCVETMHSRGRKLACLLCVSLLSGFVLTEKKKNLYQKFSNKNAAWCQLNSRVFVIWIWMDEGL